MQRLALGFLLLWFGCAAPVYGQTSEAERKAFSQVKEQADKGSAEAQFQLGAMYASGIGVKRDLTKAARWHRKAAEQGLARAQYQLGLDYASGDGVKSDQEEAARWFRRAAERQLPEAEYELGLIYLAGRGVPENGAEAVGWFRKAANQGFASGDYQIGLCYLQGTGVARDIEEGIRWLESAAQKGVAPAQNRLGTCYAKGEGVPRDAVQAYKWFALAAAQDDQHALDIKVSMAKLEADLTKDQIALAQRQAREFKPGQGLDAAKSCQTPAVVPTLPPGDNLVGKTDTAANRVVTMSWVTVKTEEPGCEIFLDGVFLGNSPAKVKVAEGLHVFEVKKNGFQNYRRELQVPAGSDLTLVPALEKP